MAYKLSVLYNGYSEVTGSDMVANCTCTLIQGNVNIIVDTMTAWDRDKILDGLKQYKLTPDDINYVVSTHGHSDHIGNNNLFLKATHIVGFSVSFKDIYYNHSFENGEPYVIDENVEIIPTPGHTLADVSVIVKNVENIGTVAVTGDLFEKEEDLMDENIWINAGSENKELQKKNRIMILNIANWIVPGHGKMFKVKGNS